jgi:hypothetical protein
LQNEIETLYEELMKTNEEMCRTQCMDALNKFYRPISENMRTGEYTRKGGLRDYQNDVKVFEQAYHTELGPLAVKVSV